MEDRVEKAVKLFKEGYNCSQAVTGAFCDIYGMDMELALRVSASFGGGLGRMREVCGAVSGMAIIAGLENGSIKGDDREGKKANYDLIVEMVNEFKKNNGTILCRELLGLDRISGNIDTNPQERNENYYKVRPCEDKVRECATIINDIIISRKDK